MPSHDLSPRARRRAALASLACFIALIIAAAALPGICADSEPLPRLAVLPFEIEDDTAAQGGPVDSVAQESRLQRASERLRVALAASGRYAVVDTEPAKDMIERLRAMQPLHQCNGCELDIARALNADRVMVAWVQKVSNLIVNLNAGIRDVRSGRILLLRSVDLRGNTDASWLRAADRLASDIVAAR